MKRGSAAIVFVVCLSILALSSWARAQAVPDTAAAPQGPVKDDTWKIYLESENKKYYFSPATMQRFDKQRVRVWEKISERTKDGEQDKVKSLIELDCSTSKYRVVAYKEFDPATGSDKPQVLSENDPWQYFTLESILGVLYDNVCYQGGVKIQDMAKPAKPKKEGR